MASEKLRNAQADEGEGFRAGDRVRVLRDGGTTRVSR